MNERYKGESLEEVGGKGGIRKGEGGEGEMESSWGQQL